MPAAANVVWTKVANQTQQPIWRVFGPILTDEHGNYVKGQDGKPVLTVLKVSPPAAAPQPPAQGGGFPPIPVVMP